MPGPPPPNRYELGSLTVDDPGIFQLSGNTLTTGSLGGTGTINLGGSGQFGGLNVYSNDGMTFSGRLTGNGAFSLAGNAELTLAGIGDYTGGTTVSGGTLDVASADAIPEGSSLTVGDASAFSIASPGAALTVVPEPGTLALLASGLLAGLAGWRRRGAMTQVMRS